MKFLLLPILFFGFISNASSQPNKEKLFKETVKNICESFANYDSVKANKYVHSETGVYLYYKPGVFETFISIKSITFNSQEYPEHWLRTTQKLEYKKLTYSKLPKFNCDTDKWNKKGAFVDTTKISYLLSENCKMQNEYLDEKIDAITIEKFRKLEKKSRRIVVVDKNKNELVFHLTFIDKKWYLTIIDKATSDCST